MADTNHVHHVHSSSPVEEDGVNYRGIVWFIVVLVVTTVVCQLLVWGLFRLMEWRSDRDDPARSALATPIGKRELVDGRVMTGAAKPATIPLLVSEPAVLDAFRRSEDATLHNYGWADKGAQTVQLPIERAKELLLERGLPARPVPPSPTPAAGPGTGPGTSPGTSLKRTLDEPGGR